MALPIRRKRPGKPVQRGSSGEERTPTDAPDEDTRDERTNSSANNGGAGQQQDPCPERQAPDTPLDRLRSRCPRTSPRTSAVRRKTINPRPATAKTEDEQYVDQRRIQTISMAPASSDPR